MAVTRSSLLLQLREGAAHAAWDEFLELYRPLITSTLARSGVPAHEIDDALQEVVMQLLRVLPGFRYQKQRGFFRGWLRRVTTNKAIDLHRKQSGMPATCEAPESWPDDRSAGEAWDREFQLGLLKSAMKCVEPEFRTKTWQCFQLRVLEGRSGEEVARQLGVSENAVYVNCSRVTGRLREFCEFHGEDLHHETADRR
ncbi:sigma-70 family RNA polymerase sigma factor [Planctomicrobium piriforme]|uniref:RNA polymerase sigma-70 factor, ECF subfamily n=1 Tax=Planctomicrobium piriforme TaxID=1576369 RepID=A0A1I3SVG5_9PLAN|nr:sigma-70 family RNA polymerase sigma factor [Planctomicrobium piriforme]SFJ62844.1 RNA polymerase sigma-70 factor, ECF subfamily [Planctomicrobium piriforme]